MYQYHMILVSIDIGPYWFLPKRTNGGEANFSPKKLLKKTYMVRISIKFLTKPCVLFCKKLTFFFWNFFWLGTPRVAKIFFSVFLLIWFRNMLSNMLIMNIKFVLHKNVVRMKKFFLPTRAIILHCLRNHRSLTLKIDLV